MKLKGTITLMWMVWALAAAVISSGKAIAIANRFLFTTLLLLGLSAQLTELLLQGNAAQVMKQFPHCARPAELSSFVLSQLLNTVEVVKTHFQLEA